MEGIDLLRGGQIGDGSRDPEYAAMRPGRKAKPDHGVFQEIPPPCVEPTIPLQKPWLQLGVRVNAVLAVPPCLPFPGFDDPRADAVRSFRGGTIFMEIAHRDGRDLDLNVDAVLRGTFGSGWEYRHIPWCDPHSIRTDRDSLRQPT
jgi:hypothetical protein